MPNSCIEISDTAVFVILRSASSSHTISHWSLLIAAHTHSTFSGVLLVASLPECGSLLRYLPIIEAFMPQFYLLCSHCIFPESLLNHPNSFHGEMIKVWCRFLALPSHFECNSHTVHTVTRQHLQPPWTKLSLFPHTHSSPLSLAARLPRCCTNHSRHINNGWTFSGQTSICITHRQTTVWRWPEETKCRG